MVDCVRGVPGGIGSGVRVKFEGGRVFDLVCLYTNSSRLRADANGVERLRARNNHMLGRWYSSTLDLGLLEGTSFYFSIDLLSLTTFSSLQFKTRMMLMFLWRVALCRPRRPPISPGPPSHLPSHSGSTKMSSGSCPLWTSSYLP